MRALVYDAGGRVLLVQERSDGLWTLSGGWCDIGESASASAICEVEEETGLQVETVRLVALFDKLKQGHPPQIPHAYKCFFHCSWVGGEIRSETDETLAGDFFPVDALPALSLHRITGEQIVTLTQHIGSGRLACLFD